MNVSLDGFVETPDHGLEWANVDEEVHSWFNGQTRELQASLYGRRMYELMNAYWPNVESDPDATPAMREFGQVWGPLPKIVFSRTLAEVEEPDRLVSGDVGDVLEGLRREYSGDMDVGGATLAAEFIERGLVDEFRMVVHPVAIGRGTPYFPSSSPPGRLRLLETQRFDSGVVYLGYRKA